MTAGRILLFGPPLAGKATICEAFARSRGARIEAFDPSTGTGEVRDRAIRIVVSSDLEVATVYGVVWNEDTWSSLLHTATALAVVLDGQSVQEDTDRDFVCKLNVLGKLPSVGCVIWTKADLIANGVVAPVAHDLLHGTRIDGWRSFGSRFDQPRTLTEPLEWLASEMARRT